MKYKLMLVVLAALGALSMTGCTGKPEDNAIAGCQAAFAGDGDQPRFMACIQGVQWGKGNIYGSFQSSSNPPPLHNFRAKYDETRAWCGQYLNGSQPDPRLHMACLDGLDFYTALLADTANYHTADYNNQVLDQNYYETHNYITCYNDFGDDGEWLFFLMHRNIFPEYYPGYRRDQYYMVLNPGPYYPYNPYLYNYSYYHFYMPSRSIGIGYTGGYSNHYFGPSAAPRPYTAGPWYAASGRPGTSGYGSVSSSRYVPGSYGSGKWGTSGSMSASSAFKSTPFSSGSSGLYGTSRSSSANTLYGTSSYGGFGSSGSGSGGS